MMTEHETTATDFAKTQELSLDEKLEQIATTSAETETELVKRLSLLSPLEYDRVRIEEAERLGVRIKTLDMLVNAERKQKDTSSQGLEEIEPYHLPVDPNALLNEVVKTIHRFIVCEQETAVSTALWVAMTWFIDVVPVAPLAVITAPEKRCGKSTLLFLLGRLVARPLTASNISPSALFRSIDAWQPTLLIDEADAFMKDNEELRGIINAGHTRESAYVIKTVGDTFIPTKFNVWGAKAISGIGHLADTLMDRAIVLELRRKTPDETVERLRHAEPELFSTLAAKLARFAQDYRKQVRDSRPHLPEKLNDRAQDNWESLLAIAEIAGRDWGEKARKAALMMAGADENNLSIGVQLLTDIREILSKHTHEHIFTHQLLEALCEDDEADWQTYNRGKPLTARQLAKRLDNYNVKSKIVRVGYEVKRGYEVKEFEEPFLRYLCMSSVPPVLSVTTLQPLQDVAFSVTDNNIYPLHTDLSVTTLQHPLQKIEVCNDCKFFTENRQNPQGLGRCKKEVNRKNKPLYPKQDACEQGEPINFDFSSVTNSEM